MTYNMSGHAPLWLHCWWFLRQKDILFDLSEEDAVLAVEQYKMMLEQEHIINQYIDDIEDAFNAWELGKAVDAFRKEMTWPTL